MRKNTEIVRVTVMVCVQCGESPPAQSDDGGQSGSGVRPDPAPATGGDRGCHHGHQVPEHCSGDPDREP